MEGQGGGEAQGVTDPKKTFLIKFLSTFYSIEYKNRVGYTLL
jgi:hypothetical protein